MKSQRWVVAILFVLASSAAAAKRKAAVSARAKSTKAKAAAAVKVLEPAAPVPVAPAPPTEPVPVPASRDEADLSLFGVALSESQDGLAVSDLLPASPAEKMGLRRGDQLLRVDHVDAKTRAQAANARRTESRFERESMVVRRNLEVLALSGAPYQVPADVVRGPADLTPRERANVSVRSGQDLSRARDAIAETPSLDWTLRAEQSFWVRFPKGIPTSVKRDDILEGEVSTGLTTDGLLDFVAFPPLSRVWARAVAANDDGEVRTLRLIFFKIRPTNGRLYPLVGMTTALAASTSQLSTGGTLVRPTPLPSPDGRKKNDKDFFVDGDSRLRVRVLKPLTVVEPPSWWRAGPGLWFKTVTDSAGHRRFAVTYVVPGRSAAAAGVKAGDVLDAVAGRSSERATFEEALEALYGPPGSTVKVSVLTSAGSRTLELTRGVKWDGQKSAPIALPFESR